MKSLILLITNIIPFKKKLIQKAANLNPKLKFFFIKKFFSFLYRNYYKDDFIETNLGINKNNTFKVPKALNPQLIFGKPNDYRGERGPLDLSLHLIDFSSCFLDIGANIGFFTYYLKATGIKKDVYYFEPNPELFELIKENTKNNNFPSTHGYPIAIGDKNGETSFFIDKNDNLSSSLTSIFSDQGHTVKKITTKITTLSTFLKENKLENVLAKVDVEGAESLFWEGAKDCKDKIKFLIIEILGNAVKEKFVQKLITEGFFAYYINDFFLEHTPDGDFNYTPPEYNWLFCKLPPTELQKILKNTKFKIKTHQDK